MLGIDYDEARGEDLKSLLEQYKLYISSMENEKLTAILDTLLDTADPPMNIGDGKQTWVSKNFEHLPLMSVITQLRFN